MCVFFFKETVEKHFHSGQNGSTCRSVASAKMFQLEEVDSDSSLDSIRDTNYSKDPVASAQWQGDLKNNTLFNNNLEKHMEKLNIEDSKNAASDNVPPRFRNSQWGKNFKKHKPWANQPKQNGNKRQLEQQASWGGGKNDQSRMQELSPVAAAGSTSQNLETSSDPWNDWEESVIVQAPTIDEGDLEELVVVDDNDTLDDVMVQQYVNALHQVQKGGDILSSKVTPSRIQELGNLKSTTNADSLKLPPGTLPNPPKGPDRWGGSELKDIDTPTGWGAIVEESGNWYDDGSTLWSNPSLPYGASGGWSWNS